MTNFFPFRSKFVQNVTLIMTGTTIAQIIPVIISPILTRIYTPEDFGTFAVYLTILSITSIVSTGRYELAIMIPSEDKEGLNVAIFTAILVVFFSFVSFVVVFFFGESITKMLKQEKLIIFLYFLPVSLLVTGFYQVLNYWNNRKARYKIIAKNRVLNTGGSSFFQLIFGIIFSSTGLLLGMITGQLMALINFMKFNYGIDFKYKNFVNKELWKIPVKYSRFPKFDVPATLLNISANQAPNIILALFFSGGAAGCYYLTQRVLQAPITLISSSILDVFKQRAAIDYQKYGNCKQIYRKTFFLLFALALPPSVVLYFYAENIFVLAFGEEWIKTGLYVKILVPSLFFRFISNPLSFMFYISEKQNLNLIGMLILFSLVITCSVFSNNADNYIFLLSLSFSSIYISYIFISAKIAGAI